MTKSVYILAFFLIALSAKAQTHFMTSFDGVQIAYSDEGNGLPVLLLHGFINDGGMWNKSILKQELLKVGYRVIVPDLRGNGESGKPESDSSYADDAEVKDLKLLITHLGIESMYAAGYSRGSIVLAKLLTEENSIEKAVLGGMGVDFTNPDWARRVMFMNAFDGKVTTETQGAVDYAKSIGANLRILHLLQKHQPVTSLEELEQVPAQVLVIAGDLDLDNGNPEALKNAIPNSELQIVPGDHNGTYKTEMFSSAILRFLE